MEWGAARVGGTRDTQQCRKVARALEEGLSVPSESETKTETVRRVIRSTYTLTVVHRTDDGDDMPACLRTWRNSRLGGLLCFFFHSSMCVFFSVVTSKYIDKASPDASNREKNLSFLSKEGDFIGERGGWCPRRPRRELSHTKAHRLDRHPAVFCCVSAPTLFMLRGSTVIERRKQKKRLQGRAGGG